MRVLWFCHNSDIGGAELCLAEAVTSLKQFGVESHVYVPWKGELEPYLRSLRVPVTRIRYRWWTGRAQDQSPLLRLRRAALNLASLPSLLVRILALKPDVIVSNTLTVPAGALAARILGIPHVWYIHELGEEDMGLIFDWGDEFSGGVMKRLSTRAVVVSHAVRQKFERWIPADRITLVYNAAEVPPRKPVPLPPLDGPLRFVTVGTKHEGKRQEDAIRAVALLAAEGVDCRLTLAGREDADYGPYLRSLTRELGVEDRVDIKRFVPDAFAEIERAHAFIMSSRNEAFGRVTIEAMKLGRPVIGSDTAGTTEFIQDGWNGLLYRAQDARDLAAKLRVLHEDRELLETMAGNARAWATPRFTLQRYATEMYAALLHTIGLGESGSEGPRRLDPGESVGELEEEPEALVVDGHRG